MVGTRITIAALAVGFLLHSIPARAQVSAATSFFFPEAVVAALPVDGTSAGGVIGNPGNAIFYFKTCPNNHGSGPTAAPGFLTNNARLHVFLLTAAGAPVVGVAAADICILLNGGTAAQGFTGPGADSLIANGTLPSTNGLLGSPLCPDVTCIPADAPTGLLGDTFITLTGAGGVRDPTRKWGHFDSEMPVFALGVPITGRLAFGAAPGSYQLSVRNLDHAGGLGVAPGDIAEAVNAADFNAEIALPYAYSRDFDANGARNAPDLNAIISHLTHNCVTPAP